MIAKENEILYYTGLKYQLAQGYTCATPITGSHIVDEYYELREDGTLIVYKGYAWDGASGPTYDSKSSMRASLVHDVFCQMMRAEQLSYDLWQDKVNLLFEHHCIEDQMWPLRAKLWYRAVEFAEAGNPEQGPDRKVLSNRY